MANSPLSNVEEQHRAKEQEELLQRQQAREIQVVMNTAEGRSFMLRLVYEISGVLNCTHIPLDPHASAFNEGQRAVGIFMLTEMQRVAKDKYLLMVSEQLQRFSRQLPTKTSRP